MIVVDIHLRAGIFPLFILFSIMIVGKSYCLAYPLGNTAFFAGRVKATLCVYSVKRIQRFINRRENTPQKEKKFQRTSTSVMSIYTSISSNTIRRRWRGRTPLLQSINAFSSCRQPQEGEHDKTSLNDKDKKKRLNIRNPMESSCINTRYLAKMSETLLHQILPQVFPCFPNYLPSTTMSLTANDLKATSPNYTEPLVIVLGVSGGCDSVALLHGIMQLSSNDTQDSHHRTLLLPFATKNDEQISSVEKKKKTSSSSRQRHNETIEIPSKPIQVQVHVVHFDHQQRGDDSNQDRLFVRDLCGKYNLPFHCYYWRDYVSGNASANTTSFTQDEARDWRRTTMIQLLQGLRGALTRNNDTADNAMSQNKQNQILPGVIMTAHHLNDSEETVLLKLLRGVHISRLQGMEAVSTFHHPSSSSAALLARPLIQISKQSIKEFLIANNLDWREDYTNEEQKYLRNRIRNELLPLLEDLVGGRDILQKRLHNLEDQSRKVHDDVRVRVDAYLEKSGTNSNFFVLPHLFHARSSSFINGEDSTNNTLLYEFGLVQEEALHSWVQSQMGYNGTFSYQQLQRVCSQLRSYPSNTIWSLDIGNGWTVSRSRNILYVGKSGNK